MAHFHHALSVGDDDPEILSNFDRIRDLGLYFNVTDQYGNFVPASYATVNHREMFATLSVAYLSRDFETFAERKVN